MTSSSSSSSNTVAEQLEKQHLESVISALSAYRRHSTSILLTKLKSAKKLLFSSAPPPSNQGQVLGQGNHSNATNDLAIFKVVIERLKSHLNLINMNAHFLYSMIENQPLFLDLTDKSILDTDGKDINLADQDKVGQLIDQVH